VRKVNHPGRMVRLKPGRPPGYFDELGLDKPRVGSVLSVADEIHLEYDVVLDRVTE
jgi:hypothetical protein